ncbi:MAG: hypothetical protein WCZ43_06695 [Proteiniphilum sp.]
MPTGAYFGTKKACQPVNIIYNYHDRKINPKLSATKKVYKEGDEWVVEVELSNTGKNIAFSIELLLADNQTENPILPVFWSDNYLSLVNDDTKTITARCNLA